MMVYLHYWKKAEEDVGGEDHSLFKVIFQYLTGVIEKSYRKLQSG
jgi:hypothetical protein